MAITRKKPVIGTLFYTTWDNEVLRLKAPQKHHECHKPRLVEVMLLM